jgi:predicted dehydrogenase
MKRKALAIVGCGAVAQRCHVPAIALQDRMNLAAVVDPDLDRCMQTVAEYRRFCIDPVPTVMATSISQLPDGIDAALIAAPHRQHAQLAVCLLERGIACLVEKPMALTSAECDCMLRAAQKGGALLAAAHVRRLYPGSRFVLELLRSYRLGTIRAIEWSEGAPYDWPVSTPSMFDANLSGGGVLADTGPHVLDLIGWWLGFPATTGLNYRDSSRGGVEAEAEMSLSFGATEVLIELSRLRQRANSCMIRGSDATLEISIDTPASYELRALDGRVLEAGLAPVISPAVQGWETLFAEQLRNFAAAVEGEEAVHCPGAEAIKSVMLIEQCYRNRLPLTFPWRDHVEI